jgi:hypothetical protein
MQIGSRPISVRDDLGRVEGLLEVVDKLLLVALERLLLGSTKNLGSLDTFALEGGKATGKDGLADQSDRCTHVEGVDGCPLASTLLASLVGNLGDQRLAVFILEAKDVAGDFDEERVEHALVPLFKNVGDLVLLEAEAALEDIVSLGYELHITVLDAVVDHLDILPIKRAISAAHHMNSIMTYVASTGLAAGKEVRNYIDIRPNKTRMLTPSRSTASVTGQTSTTFYPKEETRTSPSLCAAVFWKISLI